MDFVNTLEKTFELQQLHNSMYIDYRSRGFKRILNPKDRENNFDAPWKLDHYYDTGAEALRLILAGLTQALMPPPETILDFPSGSGRVTRHLRAFFPKASVVACDFVESHVEFCAREFDAEALVVKTNFEDLHFNRTFDVIFCGSLLTHVPAGDFRSALRLITRSLSKHGIAVITLHGRYIEFCHRERYSFIEPELFEVVAENIDDRGFGYLDYSAEPMKSLWYRPGHCGLTLSRPHWTIKEIESNSELRIVNYIERGWDATQDVLIVEKRPINGWMRNGDVPDDELLDSRVPWHNAINF